ncbi:MAG: histidine phosphatase family protein [Lachnospiraceae bacterium]|nr:histidine phosphatase family protein [Lachnospiraceae bacterium]
MRLYLIRHGRQSSKLCNVDVDISQAGYNQSILLGQRLEGDGIQIVFSSGLKRALQTAQVANYYWNAEHYMYPELKEISYGEMEGLSDSEIAVKFADFLAEQSKMEYDIPFPGGECAGDVLRRVLPVFRQIVESQYDKVAVITHGGVIRCMVAHVLGMDLVKWRTLGSSLENSSITELEWHPDIQRFTLERFNDYAHLTAHPELLRRGWTEEG